ncbi:MAG: 30S ribosomal protein S24e, partial [Methanoregula sp.]|nr:30S ribosomal protein S24e [Methanoregula sp.]
MDFEITSDKRNELLSRREVQFNLKYDGATPSRMQI